MLNNEECQIVADLLVEHLGTRSIEIQVKDVAAGRARLQTRKITIPKWAVDAGEPYAVYYVCHEVAHFGGRDKIYITGHGLGFKRVEKELLGLWDINIEYKRAYPKRLYANGVEVFENIK